MTEEIWKAVVGFEGAYEVSNLGRVRSLDRSILQPRKHGVFPRYIKGKMMSLQNHSQGYRQVCLSGKLKLVQWLVIEAFLGPKPQGCFVLHNDGNKQNNTFENLRYGTPKQNTADWLKHTGGLVGEKNPAAVLKDAGVEKIRELSAIGIFQRDIAKQAGVSQTQVSRIVNRKQWRHG